MDHREHSIFEQSLPQTVATMLPNVPPMIEAHFGVPLAGCVLNTLNIRLDVEAIAYMLAHGEAQRIGAIEYEDLLAEGDPEAPYRLPDDEWQATSLNYTSGTTGKPKGVVYHHRGAHLNAVSNIREWAMPHHPVYLWTLPMFHCNGWCFPWTIAAAAGTNICLRRVEARKVMELLVDEQVTHFAQDRHRQDPEIRAARRSAQAVIYQAIHQAIYKTFYQAFYQAFYQRRETHG